MGYIRHVAIIVTDGGYGDWIEQAQREASRIFGSRASGVVPTSVNGNWSFFIGSDGSKLGWEESETAAAQRHEFKAWLRRQEYDDGSSPFRWVEVQYGDDEGEALVLDDSDARLREPSREGGKPDA